MKTAIKFVAILMILGLVFAALPAGKVSAGPTPTVDCSSGCDQTQIQAAIDGATAGDTIYVAGGPYVLTAAINVNKAVTLDGYGSTLIKVSGTGDRFDISAGATLQGFQIQKTDKTGEQNIIRVRASGITIQNNIIWGQWVIGDGEVSRAMVFNAGAFSDLLIDNNEIYGLRQPGYISGTHTGVISNNYVHGTKGWVVEGGNLTFTGNTWAGNVGDIAIISLCPAIYYTDILALSAANNGAVVEDQRVSPAVLAVVYVDDSAAAGGNGTQALPLQTIQAGIARVIPGGTVHVAAGTYSDSLGGWRDIEINKSLSLIGAGSASTVVEFTNLQNGLLVAQDSIGSVRIEGITFTKSSTNPYSTGFGIRVGGTPGTFNSFVIKDVDVGYASGRNLHFEAATTYKNVVIEDSSFHDSGAYGVSFDGPTDGLNIANSHFDYNGKDDLTHGYGLSFESNVTNINVTGSTFDYNYAQGINATTISNATFDRISLSHNNDRSPNVNPSEAGFNLWETGSGSHDIVIKNSVILYNGRAGILLGDQGGRILTNIEIASNTFDGNASYGIMTYKSSAGHVYNLNIHHNRFINTAGYGLLTNSDVMVNAENNWWGCNAGPGVGCSRAVAIAGGKVDFNPWLVMKVSAVPALAPGGSSTFTADLTINSDNADTSGAGYLPASTVVGFTPTDYMDPDSNPLTSGKAASTFSAPVGAATFDVCAVLDGQTTCLPFSNPAPLVVYVDLDWAALADGAAVTPVYPAGAPAAVLGYNAFDNLHDALAAVSAGTSSVPGKVYVDAGTYSGTGTILIDKNWVTVSMNTGAVIQNASPCFTVAADYITIKSETLAGAKCVPTGDADGIIVTGARTNLTLEKFEIDGATGENGVHFTGVMTDLVIADLFVHNLKGNGFLFDAQPAGIIDIHGNMFRDNAGKGIEAGTFIVPAEYNSWGSYDGPTAGDGISSGVDADPWTHVDLTLSSSTPIANMVVSGKTITYTVTGNLQNVTGADFVLKYPSNLTYSSSTPGANFDSEVLDSGTPGQLHFIAYKYGAGISGHKTLFTATFTAGTVGSGLMDLDAAIDGFGMATSGSSTNIYAYALTDSTVTIKDALDLTALSLIESIDLGTWTPVFGALPSYTMGIDPANAFEYLDASSITVNHPLALGLHPYFLVPAGLPASFYTYWAGKGVSASATPGTWQAMMWQIISGTQPMFYLKVSAGPAYDLVDGLQYLMGGGEHPLRIDGTYPLGTYNFSGTVTDIYGGTDTVPVSLTLIEPLVLQSLNLFDSVTLPTWRPVYGTLAGGFTKVVDPANTFEYLDAANLVANRTLADGTYPYYLDTSALPAGFYEYWAAKGVVSGASGWQGAMWAIINGTQPMFYLQVSGGDTVFDLIDGLQGAPNPLRISGDYPLGTYHFKGTVADGFGVVGNVNVALTLIPPLDLSAADLLESVDLSTWTTVYGTLPAGYVMAIDPANPFEYLDTTNVVVNRTLANGLYPLYLNTSSLPAGFYAYWAAQGVTASADPLSWQGVMWQIINGHQPIAYFKVNGSSYDLLDGLQYLAAGIEAPLRLSGDSLLGTYTFTGTVADLFGYTDSVTMHLTLTGTWVIKGTFSMQGRTYRGDVPVALTGTLAPIFGPYSGSTVNTIYQNLTITGVQGGTYLITTLQPRYLNVIAANNKTVVADADKTMSPLELKGGNCYWRVSDGLGGWIYNNEVDLADASCVGGKYGTGTIADDADVNFDNKVTIQDLALVGGNFYLTSQAAYGIGNILPWVP